MDDGTAEYLRSIADDLTQGALMYDRRDDFGDQDMATAHLELAFSILTELTVAGHKPVLP